jgi:hypothetical protein
VNREERLALVRRLIALDLPKLYRYPGMKEELQAYVNTGRVETIQDRRLRGLMINLQARQLNRLDEDKLNAIMLEYLSPDSYREQIPTAPAEAPKRRTRRRVPRFTPGLGLGLLIYGFLGIVAILFLTQQPGYWQTANGQAIASAFLVTTIGLALFAIARSQAKNVFQLVVMLLLTVLVGGAVFLAIQSGVIDLNVLADEVTASPQRALGYGALGLAFCVLVLLIVLRKVVSTVLMLLFLAVIGVLIFVALRSDVVDFAAIFS